MRNWRKQIVQLHHLCVSVLTWLRVFSVFLSALTCRGPLAGMVDLSDVRSMSRPCSPLSVFPIPCIIRPVVNKPTHADTPSAFPTTVKMLMHRWQWYLWKEVTLDARLQALGKAREDSRGTNKWLIHPILVSSTPSFSLQTLSACLFPALHSPSVPDLGCKNHRIAN